MPQSLTPHWPGCRRTCRPCRSWRPAWPPRPRTCRPAPAAPRCHWTRRCSGSGSWCQCVLSSLPPRCPPGSIFFVARISSERPSTALGWHSCLCLLLLRTSLRHAGAVMPSPLQPIKCRGYKNVFFSNSYLHISQNVYLRCTFVVCNFLNISFSYQSKTAFYCSCLAFHDYHLWFVGKPLNIFCWSSNF